MEYVSQLRRTVINNIAYKQTNSTWISTLVHRTKIQMLLLYSIDSITWWILNAGKQLQHGFYQQKNILYCLVLVNQQSREVYSQSKLFDQISKYLFTDTLFFIGHSCCFLQILMSAAAIRTFAQVGMRYASTWEAHIAVSLLPVLPTTSRTHSIKSNLKLC